MKRLVTIIFLVLISCLAVGSNLVLAVQEEEPIKATQSDAVPVTEESLGREGDVGPPSPTMKTVDVSEFLVKKPYEKAEQEIETAPGEESRPWWKSWFFWLDEQKKSGEQETP